MLTDLRIWDGERLLAADTLIITGSRIRAVCAKADLAGMPEVCAAAVIALPGCTALPGLIDAHVHMVLDPDDSSPPAADFLPDLAAMRTRAAAMVRAGITTARDLGGGAWRELILRDAIGRGEVPGPRLLCAGQPVTCPGGHCHFWGGAAANIAEARRVIDRQVQHGVDLIKVMATGGRFTRGSKPLDPQFDQQTLEAIVSAARDQGLPVAAHCHGIDGIAEAIDAGVDTIEHCTFLNEAMEPDPDAGLLERLAR
ncbi:MAG: amidohydrolase family protein, partial [Pseudomonadales bacterium]|nr:amidohydrolase family protein [Pseudomonadales bacterium]